MSAQLNEATTASFDSRIEIAKNNISAKAQTVSGYLNPLSSLLTQIEADLTQATLSLTSEAAKAILKPLSEQITIARDKYKAIDEAARTIKAKSDLVDTYKVSLVNQRAAIDAQNPQAVQQLSQQASQTAGEAETASNSANTAASEAGTLNEQINGILSSAKADIENAKAKNAEENARKAQSGKKLAGSDANPVMLSEAGKNAQSGTAAAPAAAANDLSTDAAPVAKAAAPK